jgi:drug/metabolite transporter (DMT)-like permease
MKFNNQTFFPITLMFLGVCFVLNDGNYSFANNYPYPIGIWQKPVGILIFAIGFVLYKRSANKK